MSDWEDRWRQALVRQHRLIFDYETGTIRNELAARVRCPVCSSDETTEYCEKDWFRYQRCTNCGMVYLNPRLTDAATHEFYNSEANAIYNSIKFTGSDASRADDDAENTANLDSLEKIRGGRHGKLLEIGCADGFFLKRARERGYEVHGLELNEPNWKTAREAVGDAVLNVDLLDARYPDATFDVIYMRDLIQHIPDPKSFLAECYRVTKPGGVVFIGTHNIDGLIEKIVGSRYTPLFGFMEPNHFSPRTLNRLLSDVGYRPSSVEFRSLDFTLSEILRHFRMPTFTTVYPKKRGPVSSFLLRALHAPLVRRPLSSLDKKLTPKIANALRQGTWMNVTAVKSA